MGRLTRLTLLATLLAVLLSHVSLSDACSCTLQHPQTQFCQADFVAVVRVKQRLKVNDHEVAYKVKVHRVFKAIPKARIALERKPLWLWSPATDNMCAVPFLNPGKTWVVGGRMIGGKPSLSLCNIWKLWSEVTPRQRKGFRKLYHDGCSCQISYTEWWKKGVVFESTGGKQCLWESTPGPQDCQESHGICMRGRSGCSWAPSPAYKKCIMQHQRHREQHRTREI
ncbi:tissue inhibitor of metalloproteinase [Venturia canescens]|uniref:tissue inhibitor of metalloproteinase n=1 Tax=Venturia canescens TaxID=32260 RepID=UPI001C9BD423|nr:tissue inhibitor of metalloproteinase [Venturia canescens]XP_043289707.1 tissue inhibitor of metalloproteinase [Venturia canescens]XP_043289708.1 tissue inhibitor of metalloproteinase [Venturia canescens]